MNNGGGYVFEYTKREFKSMRSDSIAIKKLLIASITTVKAKLDTEKTKR